MTVKSSSVSKRNSNLASTGYLLLGFAFLLAAIFCFARMLNEATAAGLPGKLTAQHMQDCGYPISYEQCEKNKEAHDVLYAEMFFTDMFFNSSAGLYLGLLILMSFSSVFFLFQSGINFDSNGVY